MSRKSQENYEPEPPSNSRLNPRANSELLKNLISATGISEELISSELTQLTNRAGIKPEDLTIEDLRQILADYVQEVLLSAKAEFDAKKPQKAVEPDLTVPFPR